jgi:UPF0716 protein FxsA
MPLLLVLFIVVPVIELAAILQVGNWIGFWPTLGLLVADSILGSILMRSQGRAVWRRFNAAVAEGRPPAREVIDGVLVIFGGALLLTPGFVSDVFGLAFLLPPTRAVIRRLLVRRFSSRLVVSAFGGGRAGRAGPAGPTGPGMRYDVDGTATEVDQQRLP